MILHQNNALFIDYVIFTSQKMNILPIYVEKDYWVSYALHSIFQNEIGKDTVFKGGTSLSKCFNLINRFSEDIDLLVLRKKGETDSKLKTKIKALSKLVSDSLPEIEMAEITQKKGMNRKTAHTYNKAFIGNYGQVRDVIILEANWFGFYEPNTIKSMSSFIGEVMLKNGQSDIAAMYGMMPFEVRVLNPTRTLCEKIMSLVRFSYGEYPINDLKKKIRHIYDLCILLQQKEFSDFFKSPAFDEMLLKVANDDLISFRNNNTWLTNHPSQALLFKDLDNVWLELKNSYNGEFKNLVYGSLPPDSEIKKVLLRIKKRLLSVNWTIKLNI